MRSMTNEQIEALVLAQPDMAQAVHHDIVPIGAFVALVRSAIEAELNRCSYPECVENNDDRCPRWLTGECAGPSADMKSSGGAA